MDDSMCTPKLNNGTINGISFGKNHLLSVYTGLDSTLNDRKKKYQDRVHALLSAWEQTVSFVSETSAESPQPFFDILFISTLHVVLRADWKNTSSAASKTHLGVTLQRLIAILRRSDKYHSILDQSRILESLVKDPWGHSALCKILNDPDADYKDCLEYFKLENGKVVSVRLEMLLESKCEDLAINLSKACINTVNYFNEDLEELDTLDFTQDEMDYILDIYFSCLSKKKRTQEIIDEIKKYQINEGLILLQRYRQHSVGGKFKDRCKTARVWKCNDKIIHLLSETLLAKAVLHGDSSESQSQLEDLIKEWAAIRTVDGLLPTAALEGIRKFVLIAPSSETIYPFCSLLIRNGNCKEQYFDMVARCLIRAIIQNINEVEQLRVNKEREKLKETYCQLSKGFLLLSDLLTKCHKIYRECLLTSFSLTPTRECLQTIEAFVIQLANMADPPEEPAPERNSINKAVPSIDSSNPEVERATSGDENATPPESVSNQPENASLQCPESMLGLQSPPEVSSLSDSASAAVLSSSVTKEHDTSESIDNTTIPETNSNQIHEEPDSIQSELRNLKLGEDMDEDFNIILNYRRSHTLTWDLSWPELKANCEKYLENFEKKDFDDVELKYLDLDYNLYKDVPINYDDSYGIEKGYEHYAYSPSESEEEVSSTKKSGVSSDEETLLIHKKRKKFISSDSDEPRNRIKRARKSKPRSEEWQRRNSQKSDTGSVTDDDKILNTIEFVIAGSADADNLKKLRSYRITSMKSDDNHNECVLTEEELKKWEELHNFLEDSYKSIESIEIPPISPRFNVYDVTLDNTLVPIESEKRWPKIEDLLYDSDDFFINNIKAFESRKRREKARKAAAKREKNPIRRKRPPKKVAFPSTESYLAFTSGQQSTSLSDDDKEKHGSKPKADEKPVEDQDNTNLSPVVQLPKLCDTFNKKSFAMKTIDQNVSYASYLNMDSLNNSPISQPYYGTLSENMLNSNSIPSSSANVVNHSSGEDNIEDIENFIKSFPTPSYTPAHPPNTTQILRQSTTVDSTCQTDISDVDFLQRVLDSASSNFTNSPCPSESSISVPVPNHVRALAPTTSTSISVPVSNHVRELTPTTSTSISVPVPNHVRESTPTTSTSISVPVPNSVLESTPTTSTSISVPVPNSVLESIQTTSTSPSISVSSPSTNERASGVFSYSPNIHINNITPKKTQTKKVDQLLQDYQLMINAYPELKNVPAPRKRNNSNAPRKPRPRSKKNPPPPKKPDAFVDHVAPNPVDYKRSSPAPQQPSSPIQNGNAISDIDSLIRNNHDLLYDISPAKLPIINDASQIIQIPGERLPYQSDVSPPAINTTPTYNLYPRVEVKRIDPLALMYPVSSTTKVNGAAKYRSPAKPDVLKRLLTRGTAPNRQFDSSASAPSNEVELQIPVSSDEPQLNTNSAKNYYNPTTIQSPTVGQPVYTTPLTNGQQYNSPTTFSRASQQPKTKQNSKIYGQMKKFEVRLARIDSKIDVNNYSTNNSQFSYPTSTQNKTNLPPVKSNLLPQVVLPIISIPDSLLSTYENYQTSNFNAASTSSAGLTEVTQSTPQNVNNYQGMNDVNMVPAVSSDNSKNPMNIMFPSGFRTRSDKNDTFWYGTINTDTANPDFNTISIPEGNVITEFKYLDVL